MRNKTLVIKNYNLVPIRSHLMRLGPIHPSQPRSYSIKILSTCHTSFTFVPVNRFYQRISDDQMGLLYKTLAAFMMNRLGKLVSQNRLLEALLTKQPVRVAP